MFTCDDERWRGDAASDIELLGNSLHKRGLPSTERADEHNDVTGTQTGCCASSQRSHGVRVRNLDDRRSRHCSSFQPTRHPVKQVDQQRVHIIGSLEHDEVTTGVENLQLSPWQALHECSAVLSWREEILLAHDYQRLGAVESLEPFEGTVICERRIEVTQDIDRCGID